MLITRKRLPLGFLAVTLELCLSEHSVVHKAFDSTITALAGHVSRAMMEGTRISPAKRGVVEDLSGKDFEPPMGQNWAQFL